MTKRDNMEQLLALVDDETEQLVARLAWQAGLTAKEIRNLKWSDVDFHAGVIHVPMRQIRMEDSLAAYLRTIAKRSPFVVYSQKSPDAPTSRNNVAVKAKAALARMGFAKGATTRDLRSDFVIHMLKTHSIEETAQATGLQAEYLREFYLRQTGETLPNRKRVKAKWDYNKKDLLAALERDKYMTEVTAIMLSMMGGLSAKEMTDLKWSDVNLNKSTIRVGGTAHEVPQELTDYLGELKALHRSSCPYVMYGRRSNNQVNPVFISRRAREFLIRLRMGELNLSGLRGSYQDADKSELKEQILEQFRSGNTAVASISEKLGLTDTRMHRLIDEMCEEGKIRYVQGSREYILGNQINRWEVFLSAMPDCIGEDGCLTLSKLIARTGFTYSLVQYYINKAISLNMLCKVGRGKYRVVK